MPDLDLIFTLTSSKPVIGNALLILPSLPWLSCALLDWIDASASIKSKVAVTSGEYKLS